MPEVPTEEDNIWIMTRHGFFSVVENRDDDNAVLIRARAREDLENLLIFAGDLIKGNPDWKIDGPDMMADYRWRLWVQRDDWKTVLAALTDDIDYPNFKSAVHKVSHERADTYMKVWSVMHGVQQKEGREKGYYRQARKLWVAHDAREAALDQDDFDELFDAEDYEEMTDDEQLEKFLNEGGQPEA